MASAPLRPTPPTLAKYPIPVELITRLYRAGDEDFQRLTATMPEYARARVAAYCSERERLQDLGQRMAGTCEEATLIKAAGAKAGAALFAESRPVIAPVPVVEAAPEPMVVEEPVPPVMDASSAPAIQILDFPVSASLEAVPARSKAA